MYRGAAVLQSARCGECVSALLLVNAMQACVALITRLALGICVRAAGEEHFHDFQVALVCRSVQRRPVLLPRVRRKEKEMVMESHSWCVKRSSPQTRHAPP
jgi:hypothetical protein